MTRRKKKRVLVTGMTAAQTREKDTIAGSLAQSLRDAGHEVTVARPSLAEAMNGELQKKYDHAFVGLGPLHGIGTSTMYGALGTIGAMWADDVTLFLDDIDSSKIGSGLRIMVKHNWKLTKPFYGYKMEWELACDPQVSSWLLNVIDAMVTAGREHPRLLVPAFTFDDAFKCAGKITGGASTNVVPVDWSAYARPLEDVTDEVVQKKGPPVEQLPDEPWWAVERAPENVHVRSLGPFSWPVMQIHPPTLPIIHSASGVLMPGSEWTVRFYQVSKAGLPIVSPWRVFATYVGDAFEDLAGTIEVMKPKDRKRVAADQLEQLEKFIPSRGELSAIVEGMMYPPPKKKDTT